MLIGLASLLVTLSAIYHPQMSKLHARSCTQASPTSKNNDEQWMLELELAEKSLTIGCHFAASVCTLASVE